MSDTSTISMPRDHIPTAAVVVAQMEQMHEAIKELAESVERVKKILVSSCCC